MTGVLTARRPVVGDAPRRVLPVLVRLPVAVGAGLVTDAGFPGVGWWPAAAVGVALLLLTLRGAGGRLAFLVGGLYGFAFLAPHLKWTGTYVGPGPWLGLAAVESVFFAALAVPLALLWRSTRPRVALALGTGVLWVLMEALRGRVPFGGFPWARLGFSQADSAVSLAAPLAGVPLMGWVVATSGAVLAVAVVTLLSSQPVPALRLAGSTTDAGRRGLVAVAMVAVGLLPLLPRPDLPGDPAPPVARVGLVQGDVPEAGLDFNAERRAVLGNHARLTVELARRGEDLDVVIWPENSSDIDPLRDATAAATIQDAVDAVDVPVLIGAVLRRDDDTLRNSSMVWLPTSSGSPGPADTYLKRQIVPFGEYIPLRSLVRRVTSLVDEVPNDFVAGTDDTPVRLGPLRAAVGICYEVAFDGPLRRSMAAGADVLLIPTNNATFGYTDQSTQQLAMSRIRAMEFGVTVIQASTTGVSAIIAPDGEPGEVTDLYEPALLVGEVAASPGRTLATVIGGWVEAGLAAMGVLVIVRLVSGSWPARRSRPAPLRVPPCPDERRFRDGASPGPYMA